MNDQTSRPAMTMREIRERLGHTIPPPSVPAPTVQTTGYLVSCLPEGHDDRFTYTVRVQYRGNGLYAVRSGLKSYGTDGRWEYEPDWPEVDSDGQEAWLAAHLFDHDTALRLARELAPTLTYRGRTVADALDAEESHVVADGSDDPEHVDDCPGCVPAASEEQR